MKFQSRSNYHAVTFFAFVQQGICAEIHHARSIFLTPHEKYDRQRDAFGSSVKPASLLSVGVESGVGRHVEVTYNGGALQHVEVTYNEETPLTVFGRALGITVEEILAGIFVCMIASVPLVIALLEARPTKTDIVQSILLLAWLLSCLYLFTHVVQFRSVHFAGQRPLTLVETIYLMAQVLTTVGHGDITPANARAQIVVGLYVLFAILLIADMVSAVIHLAIARTHDYTKKLTQYSQERLEHVASQNHFTRGHTYDMEFLHRQVASLPWAKLWMTLATFLFIVTVGVLFYHFYPGENKTWLEGFYMSVITLSTVGFGAVVPATEAGKVFEAFWMLFGVVSLLSLVSGLTELILAVKAREQWTREDACLELDFLRKRAVKSSATDDLMVSRYEFVRFALVHSRLLAREEFDKIDRTFQAFSPDSDDLVPLEAIERATLCGRQDFIGCSTSS